ncbi:hypothetical protein ACWC0A_37835 [Streptomyces scopuliridis]
MGSAPNCIAQDTYVGKHSVVGIRAGLRVTAWNAGELAGLSREGVIFDSFGHLRSGRELFGRTRYVADAEGNLHCYSSDGAKTIIHPAGRRLRILTH